jgi:hypothetical protein
MSTPTRIRRGLSNEEGFTMLFALLALFVGSLLMAAAFSAANGDVKLSKKATLQAKAYYAAVAGIERYQYQLTANPNYWVECPKTAKATAVPGSSDETYTYKTLGSASASSGCTAEKQATILESTGSAKGTFRILATGTAGAGAETASRQIVATFAHPGFTKYVYESNYEVEDPVNFGLESKVCEYYYAARVEKGLTSKCKPIQFASEDKVNGPMHTNDASAVCAKGGSKPTFGRTSEDPIEMNGGHYAASGCSNEINAIGTYTESAGSLLPPETDAELLESAEYKFSGRTVLKLKTGSPNTIEITKSEGAKETKSFPKNGVVYVENSSSGCGLTYTPFNTDTTKDTGCGNVYVSGEYTESLTIASAGDVIVNGNLTTSSESNGEPTGGATLGLIAENYVRVYHPVKQGYTTSHVTPALEAPINSKCITVKELNAKVFKSTEVSEITTTGLTKGTEVEGTVAGMIESGTTISEIKESEKKIKLSKAAKPTAKEATGKIVRSTEVTEITTTGLSEGQEVEGTVAGTVEAGTTISEIKASEKKIKLSNATKQSVKEISGTTNKTTEITNITPTGLIVGDEIEGSGIPAKTTVTEIKASEKKIKISNAATKSESNIKLKFYGESTKLKFYGENTKLKFNIPTGYEYNATLGKCHKVESGYDKYIESENLYIINCESNTSYTSESFCKYENDSGGCSSKVTNLSAGEDPNGWGALENPTIDAAILSTKHSWIVDNYKCGKKLGELNVWGSIAQFWRGPVGTSGGEGTGYIKDYNYDERLATQQPPNFLSPSSTSWKLSRETTPPANYCSSGKC